MALSSTSACLALSVEQRTGRTNEFHATAQEHNMAVTSREIHRQPNRTAQVTLPQLQLPDARTILIWATYIGLGIALLSIATGRAGIWLDDLRYVRSRL